MIDRPSGQLFACVCVPVVLRVRIAFFFRKGITVNLRQVSRAKQNVEKKKQQQRESGVGEPGWAHQQHQQQQTGAPIVTGSGGGGKRRKIGGAPAGAAAMTTAAVPVANWSSESDREVCMYQLAACTNVEHTHRHTQLVVDVSLRELRCGSPA